MTSIAMNTEGLVLLLSNIDDPMKTVRSILFTSLFALLLTSCTKESFDEKIVGKWQIQGMYQPDARGQISWWNIPSQACQWRMAGMFWTD